jgi:Glycerophosphoryl diester phosphodiesterase family
MKFALRAGHGIPIALLFALTAPAGRAVEEPRIAKESPDDAKRRHERVAERRKGTAIICHRGASEFAHENTLEAYRAALELGADGNEIDIRATEDGVLVLFHDDMLDRLLEAHGDVGDYTWEELQQFRFRDPGRFGNWCRIPTLVEVFELHRRHAGLLHLDIKRTGLDRDIADLLTRMDMWDHVTHCNAGTGGVILPDPRLRPRRYRASLYLDRAEVFPDQIAAGIKKTGDDLIVDDPRGAIVALGRNLGAISKEPVVARIIKRRPVNEWYRENSLVDALRNAGDWDRPATSAIGMLVSGARIRARAIAAERLLQFHRSSKDVLEALEERVRNRSLHRHWMFHGLDGAMALRALIGLRAPRAVDVVRETLWRDDPVLEQVADPRWKNPRAWTDFRVKMVIFPALENLPGAASERLCRDYLALSDDEARKLGPPLFEAAGRALLAISPTRETAVELMAHRLQVVRGRAILDCLGRAQEPWAVQALEKSAPHALPYRVESR